jgi:hypothetical protein
MASKEEQIAEIARIASQYQELVTEGAHWSGGPVSSDAIKSVAEAVMQSMDARTLLRGLAESDAPEAMIRGLLAISWAQGFNVGAKYSDRRGPGSDLRK